jgi:uncharacterized protein (TIGR02246 family)
MVITLPKAEATQACPTALTWWGFAGILCEISPRDIGLGQSGLGGHYINVKHPKEFRSVDRHPVELQIEKADKAIVAEDFDTLMDIYSDDAILVVTPGLNAIGKIAIREAFEKIAVYFKNGLQVEQKGMKILESGNTVLVLANTTVSAPNFPATERKATYVFNKAANGSWLCSIDNSYGHEVIESNA